MQCCPDGKKNNISRDRKYDNPAALAACQKLTRTEKTLPLKSTTGSQAQNTMYIVFRHYKPLSTKIIKSVLNVDSSGLHNAGILVCENAEPINLRNRCGALRELVCNSIRIMHIKHVGQCNATLLL